MIYCLTGKLLEKAPDYAVVSCGGVGYLAAIVRNGFVTFSVIFMLAAGAAAPIFLFNKRAHSLTRNKKQIRS
jgi:hypothetical protein